MAFDELAMVKEFHKAYNLPDYTKPTLIDESRAKLRVGLIKEETKELEEAIDNDDIVKIADGLGDLLYVVYGACLEWGIPIKKVFQEIHRSNMTKLGPNGEVIRRSDGKVIKGPNYEPPNLGQFF